MKFPDDPNSVPEITDEEIAELNGTDTFHLDETPTDTGNAYRFARLCKDRIRYVPESEEWLIWDGKCWKYDNQNLIFNLTMEVCKDVDKHVHEVSNEEQREWTLWAKQSKSLVKRKAMVDIAATLPELIINEENLNNQPYLFNFITCTLNLQPPERTCYEHSPQDNITKICPTPYDPYIESSILDEFLNRFMPDKEERLWNLTSLAVAIFTGRNFDRKLLMLLGPSSTGKSALMELMAATFGKDYIVSVNASVFRGNMDDKPRPDLIRASHAQLITAFEASDAWELHTDHIKKMTGGDPMAMRGMHSNTMRETIARFTPCIIANQSPKISGSDSAIRRRLHILIMDSPVDPSEDDGTKRAALVNDYQARMALVGLLVRLYIENDGRMPKNMPPRVAAKTMEVFAALDNIDEMIKMLIDEGVIIHDSDVPASHCVKTLDLHRAVVKILSAQRSRDIPGPKQFSQRLIELGYVIKPSGGSRIIGFRQSDYFYSYLV